MNLKKLKEKRDMLLNNLTDMVTDLENGEVRALTEEERAAFDAKKIEIEDIDATIARVEEMRAREVGKDAVAKLEEERNIEDAEKRALEAFFRGHDLEAEQRTILSSVSNNQALMPVEVSKTIMKKLEEQCPILEKARRFSTKGTLRLIKEDSYGEAGLTAENTKFKDTDVTFKYVELRSFKISAMCNATFEMLQNVEVDLTQYLLEVITRRLAKEINKLLLIGEGTNQPKGLAKKGIEVEFEELDVKTLIEMTTTMHPTYMNGACWIVNRDTFTEMAKLLDGNGRPYLISNYDQVNNKIAYSFLGLPVVVDAFVPAATPVILANIAEAYAVNILQDISVRHLVESGFTQGFETFAGYVMLDGQTINEDAVVLGKKNGVMKARVAKK